MPRGVKRSSTYSTPGGARKKPMYKLATTKRTRVADSYKLLKTSQLVTMRYSTSFTLDPAATTNPAIRNFRANGMFDPDATGIGHQPRGFDQLMALYDHYIVEEACLEAWYESKSASDGVLATLAVRDTLLSAPDRIEAMETRVMTESTASGSNGGKIGYIRLSVKPHEFLGLDKNDAELRGSITSNAGDQVFFNLGAMPIGIAADHPGVNVVVKITYQARLIEPKEPGQS